MLHVFLVQPLCSSGPWVILVDEAGWVYIYKAVVDFVEHLQGDLSSSLLKTSPFQIFEHRINNTW